MPSSQEDSLLTDLCTICHLQPPKYRCPRCNTRTCSLPCTRRHKLWSQCSGVRDPAAYLRRSELATETAFDRDFNFITGIERSIERAGRDAENRGIRVDGDATGFVRDLAVVGLDDSPSSTGTGKGVEGEGGEVGGGAGGAGGKRKRGAAVAAAVAAGAGAGAAGAGAGAGGPAKGESAFLREVRNAGVKVIRAPRGMSRNKENGSRWFAKQQCLVWTVEWIGETGEKRTRNCRDSVPISISYDRAFPLSREEREKEKEQEQTETQTQNQEQGEDQGQAQQQELPSSTTENVAQQPEDIPSVNTTTTESSTTAESTAPTTIDEPHPPTTTSSEQEETHAILPHRNVYFYLHRPRTATKHPVLIPLAPSMTLTAALHDHTVIEFPTIYVLPDSPDALRAQGSDARYLLEDEYIRTHAPVEENSASPAESEVEQQAPAGIDLGNVDEKKVLEVLKKDLFEPTTLG
ncbi:hypothetical protein ASPACDRAFT_41837 [Aspergillus aculeatus ATCC 16872]|uniref:Box C/D snoRNA protein 1 n=1 Tax=Aspergillus aculeatus (strain ATCC 16872 / CBS 172.66 / WB 5094) TaxID=690307 RepID=A0A1L9WZK3_ASPA1|nr:uncharacterized protein ASPACDRAFT_41837 [Aspergillus aculeatus ATCC 16872]OJK01574.1 hypothetical protein ASPACDRAFT_41837 [Aspergillus aculeatus ATCC 16872]